MSWPDALELLLAGETINAAQASKTGLAWRVTPHDELMAEARPLAGRLCAGALLAVRATKELPAGRSLPWTEAACMGETMRRVVSNTHDVAEGRAAWRERRPPQWQAR